MAAYRKINNDVDNTTTTAATTTTTTTTMTTTTMTTTTAVTTKAPMTMIFCNNDVDGDEKKSLRSIPTPRVCNQAQANNDLSPAISLFPAAFTFTLAPTQPSMTSLGTCSSIKSFTICKTPPEGVGISRSLTGLWPGSDRLFAASMARTGRLGCGAERVRGREEEVDRDEVVSGGDKGFEDLERVEDCGAVRWPDADLVSKERDGLEDEVGSVSEMVVHATAGTDGADSELEGPQLATGSVFDPVDTAIGAAGFPVENEFAEN